MNNISNIQKIQGRVWFVFATPNDATVMVAMDVEIKDNYVSWFDTVKERCMKFDAINTSDVSQFEFTRAKKEGGGVYTFIPMTLDVYNAKVKGRLWNAKEFTSEEEMLKSFELSREDAW